ncbi:hypothetical protein LEMLEM_LOCUS23679, partial [Lemmus lemmus]
MTLCAADREEIANSQNAGTMDHGGPTTVDTSAAQLLHLRIQERWGGAG